MAKLAKLLLLVAIVVAALAAVFLLRQQPAAPARPVQAEIRGPAADAQRPRLEEKYGFTSETVEP